MGVYVSDDGYRVTSTLDRRPFTFLSEKGTRIVIKIQRWWKTVRVRRQNP